MRDDLLKGLTDEQKKKVIECKEPEQILALAKQEGIELSDEQLEAVSGGCGMREDKCEYCGSKNYTYLGEEKIDGGKKYVYRCNDCGKEWTVLSL